MPAPLGYFEYSEDESASDVKDVLDLTQRPVSALMTPEKRSKMKISSRLKKMVSPSNQPKCDEISEISRSTPRRQPARKQTKLIHVIPKQCATAWVENHGRELKRFLKLTTEQHKRDSWFWDAKLQTDLPLANKLQVTGLVEEVFDFSLYDSGEVRKTLVEVFIKFLKASVKEVIGEACTYLSEEGCTILSEKVVAQGVTTLCQDFINEPYFRLLKIACEQHGLKLLTFKDGKPGSDIVGNDGSVWKTEVNIHLSHQAMVVEVRKIFCTVWVTEMEMLPSDYIFAFRRRYSIDMLGGPPNIEPPLWMGYSCGKIREIQSKPVVIKSPRLTYSLKDEAGTVSFEDSKGAK